MQYDDTYLITIRTLVTLKLLDLQLCSYYSILHIYYECRDIYNVIIIVVLFEMLCNYFYVS